MDYISYGDDRWEIICGHFAGPEKRAVEMLYEALAESVPYIPVARCAEKADPKEDVNRILVGTLEDNIFLRSYVEQEDVQEGGFLVRVCKDLVRPERQVVALVGSTPTQTLYAVSHFLDDYLALAQRNKDHIPYFKQLFQGEMPLYEYCAVPAFEERGIWTWGHCIYDHRRFAQNMARMGLNAITIWNDFAPLNLKEVIDCFHSYGILVNLGYSWGWDEGVNIADPAERAYWTQRAAEIYQEEYASAGGDGIYFQAFTETCDEERDGVSIADAVVAWVNAIGGEMLARWPELHIQFGLHATSVKNHLEVIRQVDPRIAILWEDCGAFPYSYLSRDTENFEETLKFSDAMAALRPGTGYGAVLKGQVCLDWSRFEHQKGSFVLGCAGAQAVRRRARNVRAQWHDVQSYWLQNAEKCRQTLQHLPGAAIYSLVEDALLEEACWYPTALYAQLLWKPELGPRELLQRVAQRKHVELA